MSDGFELTKAVVTRIEEEAVRLCEMHPEAVYTRPEKHRGDGPNCFYASGKAAGQTGCVVGQAARRAGVPGSVLVGWDGDDWEKPKWRDFSPKLYSLQRRQDQGVPWGKALEETLEEEARILVW